MKEVDGIGTALARVVHEPSARVRHRLCSDLLRLLFPTVGSVLLSSETRPEGISDELLVVAESYTGPYQLTDKGKQFLEQNQK